MHTFGDIVANIDRSTVYRSGPSDGTFSATAAAQSWSDQTNARNLKLATWRDF